MLVVVIGGNCGNGDGGGIAVTTATKGRKQQCRESAILINAKLLSPLWFVARFYCSLPVRQLKILSLSSSFFLFLPSLFGNLLSVAEEEGERVGALNTRAATSKKSLLFSSAPLCALLCECCRCLVKEKKEEEKEKRTAEM